MTLYSIGKHPTVLPWNRNRKETREREESMVMEKQERELSIEGIARLFAKEFLSIYDIDLKTGHYRCRYESDSYSEYGFLEEGTDFFSEAGQNILRVVYKDDQAYVLSMYRKKTMEETLSFEEFDSFSYRIIKNGRPVYVEASARKCLIGDDTHIVLSIRDVDNMMQRQFTHKEELEYLHRRENLYLEVILSGAEAYVEVDLSSGNLLSVSWENFKKEHGPHIQTPKDVGVMHYRELRQWFIEHVCAPGKGLSSRFRRPSDLTACFRRGEKRVTEMFSAKMSDGSVQPGRLYYYLFEDEHTQSIHALIVMYILTEAQQREYELTKLRDELQMSRIRNSTKQMQPHFLYNALGSIQELMLSDPEYASELLGDFTIHLRSCVRAMSSDAPIPFTEELDNIRAYVNIEKMRFGDRLEVRYEIGTEDFLILPLCVQPLVENAIRHGIYRRGKEGGRVTIRTKREKEGVLIQVDDDGVGFDLEKFREEMKKGKKDSTGLANLRFRLEKVLGASISIDSKKGKGTTVTIHMPKEE